MFLYIYIINYITILQIYKKYLYIKLYKYTEKQKYSYT
jgi:hypothetical protein